MSLVQNKNFAYIFDFDGVLVDSMNLHYQSLTQVCRDVGIQVSYDEFAANAGVPTRQQIIWYAEKSPKPVDVESMFLQYRLLFIAGIDQIDPITCNLQLMKTFNSAGIKTAIASSGLAEFVLPIVKRLGIICDAVVTIDDVKHGKPAPDLFLKAAGLLDVEPADCIVIEDADLGIQAAHRAGMATLRYETPCCKADHKNTKTTINTPELTTVQN